MRAWQDRFQPPTAEMLLSDLPQSHCAAFKDAIRDLGGRAKPVWVASWNWTLHLETPVGPVYFIPDPESPRIAVRLPKARFERLRSDQRADRAARSALIDAGGVGETVWTEWAVADPETLGTLVGSLKRTDSA